MKDKRKDLVNQIINFISAAVVTLPFAYVWYNYYAGQMQVRFFRWGHLVMLALYVIIYVSFGQIYGGFSLATNRISSTLFSQALALLLTNGVMYLIMILILRRYRVNIIPLSYAYAAQLVLITITTTVCHKWYFFSFPPYRAAVIYDMRVGMEDLIRKYGLFKEFSVKKVMDIEKCLEDLSALDDMDVVFLSGIHSHERNIVMKYCVANNMRCYVIPRVGDIMLSGAKRTHMFHLEILEVGPYDPPLFYSVVKRVSDIVIALVVLIVLSPLMLVVALAIKIQDGGPVFYRQERLTKDGKRFMLTKFRSMCVDAESDGVARLSTGEGDERVTSVGRFIRRFRMDELPQLFSVLKGDMSICGPRPERPEIAEQYEKVIPEFRLRLQAKAGLTGYAQVYGKYNTPAYDKLLMDLAYISNPSLLYDIRILFSTLKVLLLPESTEGIEQGQTTAEVSARRPKRKKAEKTKTAKK